MPASAFLKSFLEGTPSKEIRMVAAGGFAPLPPEETLQLLVHLIADPDETVSSRSRETLRSWSDENVLVQVQRRECSLEVLQYFASAGSSETVLEGIILNSSTPGWIVAAMVLRGSSHLIETALYNRARLQDCPEILRNVRLNPAATPQLISLADQIESELLRLQNQNYSIDDSGASPEAVETSPEFEPAPDDLSLEGLPEDPEAREDALAKRLASLSVRQKIQHAMVGNREVRAILIRDPNREVSRTVLHSPKLSDNEVEAFASMRNISEELLREIGNSREWTRSYNVVQNLVRNPKTPPSISQRMLFRLQSRDLQFISRDRGIPEAVRTNALRTLKAREQRSN